jgi:hypothetical protein
MRSTDLEKVYPSVRHKLGRSQFQAIALETKRKLNGHVLPLAIVNYER